MLGILVLARRIADAPPETRPRLDVVGAVLSALGLGLVVFGVLRSSEWGWVQPKAGGQLGRPLADALADPRRPVRVWLFFRWEDRREARGEEPLVRPRCCGTGSSAAA